MSAVEFVEHHGWDYLVVPLVMMPHPAVVIVVWKGQEAIVVCDEQCNLQAWRTVIGELRQKVGA